MSVTNAIRRHPVATYFAMAFGIAWGGILLLAEPNGTPGAR